MKFEQIKHLHPDGLHEPNGSFYQRGGYMKECRDNANSFNATLPHSNDGKKGGFIVLPTGTEIPHSGFPGKIGHQFTGRYLSLFNSDSITIELDNFDNKALMRFVENLAITPVLVKDLNDNSIYIVRRT